MKSKGKIVFIIFLFVLAVFMAWVIRQYEDNTRGVLDRTAYIDRIYERTFEGSKK